MLDQIAVALINRGRALASHRLAVFRLQGHDVWWYPFVGQPLLLKDILMLKSAAHGCSRAVPFLVVVGALMLGACQTTGTQPQRSGAAASPPGGPMVSIWQRDGWLVRRNSDSCAVVRAEQPRESMTLLLQADGSSAMLLRSPMLQIRANQRENARIEFSNGGGLDGPIAALSAPRDGEALIGLGQGGAEPLLRQLSGSSSMRATVGRFKTLEIDLASIAPAIDALRLCMTQPQSFPQAGAAPQPARDNANSPTSRQRVFGSDTAYVQSFIGPQFSLCTLVVAPNQGTHFTVIIQRGGQIDVSADAAQWRPAPSAQRVRIQFSDNRGFEIANRPPERSQASGIFLGIDPSREDDIIDGWAASTSVRVIVGNAPAQTFELPMARENSAALKRCLVNIRAVHPVPTI